MTVVSTNCPVPPLATSTNEPAVIAASMSVNPSPVIAAWLPDVSSVPPKTVPLLMAMNAPAPNACKRPPTLVTLFAMNMPALVPNASMNSLLVTRSAR